MIWTLLVAAALAAQAQLVLETADIHEGQTVGLNLVVRDAEARGVPRLTAPDGLTLAFEGQSQQHMINNFKASSSTTYRYALTATKAGDYTLGPWSVESSAGSLKVDAVQLKVGSRESTTSAVDQVVAEIGADTAWVGQVLMLHLRFVTDKTLVSGRWSPPDPQGFTAEPSVQPLPTEARLSQDGKQLNVQELFYTLRAARPGRQVIPGGVIQAQFAVSRKRSTRNGDLPIFQDLPGFTDVRTEVFSAKPKEIEVKALPEAGRPKSFTGLVGQFTMTASPSVNEVGVGQTVTVDIEVVGDGALGGVNLPPLTGDGFAIYDDKPLVEAQIVDGRYRARALFKRAIVPDRPGDLTLPPIELSWFDPVAGAYHTEASPPITLKVTGASTQTEIASFATSAPKPVDALGEDILPVRANARVSAALPGTASWAMLLPGVLLLAAQVLPKLKRTPRAAVEARMRWEDLPQEPDARLAALDRMFREEAARRLSMAPAALHREDAAKLGPECEAIYKELDTLRYGGRGTAPEARIRTFVEGA